MDYLPKVGICAAVMLAPMALSGMFSAGQPAQFKRLADCMHDAQGKPLDACVDPETAKLYAEMQAAYDTAKTLYGSGIGLSQLEEFQRSFMDARGRSRNMEARAMAAATGVRPNALETIAGVGGMLHEADLPKRRMERWVETLKSLAPPRDGMDGRWVNHKAEITISGRKARIKIAEAGPEGTECTITARVSILGGLVALESDGSENSLGSWTMNGRHLGAPLTINERGPNSLEKDDGPRPYCGGAESLGGTYFPAKDKFADSVLTWLS